MTDFKNFKWKMEKLGYGYGSTSLIQMVKERPCIWDKNCDLYKNKLDKDNAWREIYCAIEPGYDSLEAVEQRAIGNQITKKWYNIRDSYVKWLKGGGKRIRPYLYHEYLTFLDRFVEYSRKSALNDFDDYEDTNIETANGLSEVFFEVNTSLAEEQNTEADVIELPEEHLHNDDSDSVKNALPKKVNARSDKYSKRKGSKNDPMAVVLLKLLKKSEDEDQAFFTSILPAVKKMTDESKYEFRMEVMKLITKMNKKDKRSKLIKDEASSE